MASHNKLHELHSQCRHSEDQSFVHALNNPFGQKHLKDTNHPHFDGRKSGHLFKAVWELHLKLFYLTAHAGSYTAKALFYLFFLILAGSDK